MVSDRAKLQLGLALQLTFRPANDIMERIAALVQRSVFYMFHIVVYILCKGVRGIRPLP